MLICNAIRWPSSQRVRAGPDRGTNAARGALEFAHSIGLRLCYARGVGLEMGHPMKTLLAFAIVLALAIILILTKPTPQDIASAATGQMNYVVLNKDKMPRDFVAAVAAAAVVQSVQDIFLAGEPRSATPPVMWRTRDLVVLMYSDLTLRESGSLKCLWLLRNGFCTYIAIGE